jgi:Tol biopolymer transport system component
VGRFHRLAVTTAVVLAITSIAQVQTVGASAPNGRIAFMRFDVTAQEQFVWTVNPDGTHEEQLLPYPSELPRWSPDGREIAVQCCDAAAQIVAVDTGATRTLPEPAGLFLLCDVWTADGARLLCEGFGNPPDDNNTPSDLDGIYSIRASDGSDIRRVTTDPGGFDGPQDVSPDGSELLFLSFGDPDALLFVGLNGSGLRRVGTGGLFDISSASWSPDGQWIVFPARKTPDQRRSLFVVHPDGSDLHEIAISPACGGSVDSRNSRGCLDPTWSPDGSKILFDIFQGYNFQKYLHTVNPDGSHLEKVTRHGFVLGDDEGEQGPDWGTHPLE